MRFACLVVTVAVLQLCLAAAVANAAVEAPKKTEAPKADPPKKAEAPKADPPKKTEAPKTEAPKAAAAATNDDDDDDEAGAPSRSAELKSPLVAWEKPLVEEHIRCAVCQAAVRRTMLRGVELGLECEENKGADKRCNGTRPELVAIEAIANQTCQKLALEFQATEVYNHDKSIGIELEVADTVDQPDSVKKAITDACVKWTEQFVGTSSIAFSAYAAVITASDFDMSLHGSQSRHCHLTCASGYVHPKDEL